MKLSERGSVYIYESDEQGRVTFSIDVTDEVLQLEAVADAAKEIIRTAKGDTIFPMDAHVPAIRINILQEALVDLEDESEERNNN